VRWVEAGAGDGTGGGSAGDGASGAEDAAAVAAKATADKVVADKVISDKAAADKVTADAAVASVAAAGSVNWRSKLAPEIKDHACLQKYQSSDDVVKAYVDAQSLIGVDKLPIPPAGSNPEARDKFLNIAYDRLGRPKEAKDYKLSDTKIPEGVKIEQATMDAFKAESWKLGLLPHQLDGVYKFHMADMDRQIKAHKEQLASSAKESEAALRLEYGAAYDAKVTKAQTLLNSLAGDDYKQLLDSGFGNNPAVVRFMAKMADLVSEDSLTKGTGEVTMTPKEAEVEIAKVQNQLLAMDKSNPEYKLLLQRKRELYEMAVPNKEIPKTPAS